MKAMTVPAEGVSAVVGSEYVAAIREFVGDIWSIGRAQTNALSRESALRRISELRNTIS